MSAKHTPGPWQIVEHSWSDTGIYANDKQVALLNIAPYADEDTQQTLEAEAAANARLIAAAPKLLEALLGIVEIGKRDMSNLKYDVYFAEARAALADAGVDLP